MQENSFIKIDFNQNPLMFKNPLQIIKTHSLHEINECFKQIEQAVQDGYYAAGFLSYEASTAFNIQYTIKQPNHMPLLWFGIFEHPEQPKPFKKKQYSYQNWLLSETKDQFKQTFNKVQQNIQQGKISQVNYTTRYETHFSGDAYSYYHDLKNAQQADYSAYIHTNEFDILSLSPELFFEIDNNTITTKPMKGTIGRGLTYEDDLQKRKWLEQSEKNQYENKLATDLMCQELTQITKPNSIHIYDQFRVKQYPTLYQMTTTIDGKLHANTSLTSLFKTLFPCTSITGTPKSAAMKLISELEQSPRNVYCGTIGFITPKQKALFNVPIRTVVINHHDQKATYGVGGAITAQSTVDEEFTEIQTKAKVLQTNYPTFNLLETISLIDGKYIVLENHLKRLEQSAKYFNFPINITNIKHDLLEKQDRYSKGKWRLRLLVSKDKSYNIEIYELHDIQQNMPVTLAEKPLQKNNPFLYHKTTNRLIYEKLKSSDDYYFDTLLWNEDKQITEFTIGNIVVKLNGELITPPVEDGLLPGTYREKLLEENVIKEQSIYLDDLKQCTHIWLINSVRQWVQVTLEQN